VRGVPKDPGRTKKKKQFRSEEKIEQGKKGGRWREKIIRDFCVHEDKKTGPEKVFLYGHEVRKSFYQSSKTLEPKEAFCKMR